MLLAFWTIAVSTDISEPKHRNAKATNSHIKSTKLKIFFERIVAKLPTKSFSTVSDSEATVRDKVLRSLNFEKIEHVKTSLQHFSLDLYKNLPLTRSELKINVCPLTFLLAAIYR